MEIKQMIECLKISIVELASKKYEEERIGIEKASLDFINTIEKQITEIINLLEKIKKFYDLKMIDENEYQLKYEIELFIKRLNNG